MNEEVANRHLASCFDRWRTGIRMEPKEGCIFQLFRTESPTGQLTVWIIDDAWPFDGVPPKSVGEDKSHVLSAMNVILQHSDVECVIACQHAQFTIAHLQNNELRAGLLRGNVCLLLDLFGADDEENIGRELALQLIEEPNGENRDGVRVPFNQSALFTKRGDNSTSNKLSEFITKPGQIQDPRGLESLMKSVTAFIDRCGTLHRSRLRRAFAEKEIRELAELCRRFHDPASTHDVGKLLNDIASMKYAVALRKDVKTNVERLQRELLVTGQLDKERCSAFFAPFLGELNAEMLTALFSTSKSLSLRAKGLGNIIPGYWIRKLLNDAVPIYIDRWAIRLTEVIPFSGVLASIETLAVRATAGISAEGITATLEEIPDGSFAEFAFVFSVANDPNQLGLGELLSQVNDALLAPTPYGEHSTKDAVTALIHAGFRISTQIMNGGDQLNIRAELPGTLEWPLFLS